MTDKSEGRDTGSAKLNHIVGTILALIALGSAAVLWFGIYEIGQLIRYVEARI